MTADYKAVRCLLNIKSFPWRIWNSCNIFLWLTARNQSLVFPGACKDYALWEQQEWLGHPWIRSKVHTLWEEKKSDVECEDGYRHGFIFKNTVIPSEKFLLLSIAIRWIRMTCQVGPSVNTFVLCTQKERHLHQILNSLGSEGCLYRTTWVLRNFVSLCVSNFEYSWIRRLP